MMRPDPEDEVAHLRTPPNSIEAEQSVLGGLLIDNSAWDRVGDTLTREAFYRYEHRLIFDGISALITANKPADMITVAQWLRDSGLGDAGGTVYLDALSKSVPSASNIRRYAEIVRDKHLLRQVVAASDEMATAAFNTQGRTASTIIDEAQAKILALSERGVRADEDWVDMDASSIALLDHITAEFDGTEKPDIIPTGIIDLDTRLEGGMRPGELIVIGARPSMGKSALAMSILLNAGASGTPGGLLSMEMLRPQLQKRMLSNLSSIHFSRIKNPERLRDIDWASLSSAVERLRVMPVYVNDRSGLTIGQVRTMARRLVRTKGMRLLVIDYLGLMAGTDPKQPRVYQLEDITKGLKALAGELGIAILLLAQVKRGVEERSDQMPMLSDLRDSGSIEQDADVVMFVHREYKARPDIGDEWKYYAKIMVAKLRDGEPGVVHAMYVGENIRFKDWPIDEPLPRTEPGAARRKKNL